MTLLKGFYGIKKSKIFWPQQRGRSYDRPTNYPANQQTDMRTSNNTIITFSKRKRKGWNFRLFQSADHWRLMVKLSRQTMYMYQRKFGLWPRTLFGWYLGMARRDKKSNLWLNSSNCNLILILIFFLWWTLLNCRKYPCLFYTWRTRICTHK